MKQNFTGTTLKKSQGRKQKTGYTTGTKNVFKV